MVKQVVKRLCQGLVFVLVVACSTTETEPRTAPKTLIFSRPYPEAEAEEKVNSTSSGDVASRLADRSCEDGRRMIKRGVTSIDRARRIFTGSLEKLATYDQSHMLLLQSEQEQLEQAGTLRDDGVKTLHNGLYILYERRETQSSSTGYRDLDQLLREERSLTNSIEAKEKGLFSDFEGIYSGLQQEAELLNQISVRTGKFLDVHSCP